MKFTSDIIRRLPKAELHCHLDGSPHIETILNLASDQGVKLPSNNKKILESILMIGDKIGSLEEYLNRFDIILSVLQTPKALTDLMADHKLSPLWRFMFVAAIAYTATSDLETATLVTLVFFGFLHMIRTKEEKDEVPYLIFFFFCSYHM